MDKKASSTWEYLPESSEKLYKKINPLPCTFEKYNHSLLCVSAFRNRHLKNANIIFQ